MTLIVTLMGAYYAFYLSRATVDLKYTLSERIVISTQGESVQQLEIKNLGNASAEKIVINLAGDIQTYSIIKNVESDIVQEFSTSDGLQIVYPDLPPQSSIKIALTSIGKDGCKVLINHSKGVAKEALSSSSSSGVYLFANILIIFMLAVYIWLNIKNTLISVWYERAISKYTLEKVLKRPSPPIFLKKRWEDIREIALQQVLLEIIDKADRITTPVQSTNCFQFLDEKMFSNDMISIEEKINLVEIAQEVVKLHIHIKCNKIYNLSDFVDLLKIEKPKLFLEDRWSELRGEVIKSYLQAISREDFMFSKIYEIDNCETAKLLSRNLDFLYDRERMDFSNKAKKTFLSAIKQKIDNTDSYGQKDIESLCQAPLPSFILQHEWDEVIAVARRKYALLNLQNAFTWSMGKVDCEEIFALVIPQRLKGSEWSKFLTLIEKYYSILAIEVFLNTFSEEKIINDFQINHIYNWDAMKEMFKQIEHSRYIHKAITSSPKGLINITN